MNNFNTVKDKQKGFTLCNTLKRTSTYKEVKGAGLDIEYIKSQKISSFLVLVESHKKYHKPAKNTA